MALTEEQEKELLAAVPALKKQVGDLSATVTAHAETIKAKDAEIQTLKQGHTTLSQQTEKTGLKAAYPDVPEQHLQMALEMPADKREGFLKPTQELASKAKAAQAKADSNDSLSLWARTGSIGPTDDAARAAEAAEQAKARDAAKNRGDVAGMLATRTGEVADFLRGSLAKAGLIKA